MLQYVDNISTICLQDLCKMPIGFRQDDPRTDIRFPRDHLGFPNCMPVGILGGLYTIAVRSTIGCLKTLINSYFIMIRVFFINSSPLE